MASNVRSAVAAWTVLCGALAVVAETVAHLV